MSDAITSCTANDWTANAETAFRSTLVTLLVLAELEKSPLTNRQVAVICRFVLDKFPVGQSEQK